MDSFGLGYESHPLRHKLTLKPCFDRAFCFSGRPLPTLLPTLFRSLDFMAENRLLELPSRELNFLLQIPNQNEWIVPQRRPLSPPLFV